jgi:hypothetical protein
MGADRSRTRARTPKALRACLVVMLVVSMSPPAMLITSAKASHPHKKKQKPGSSCSRPFQVNQGVEGRNGGTHYVVTTFKSTQDANRRGAIFTWTWRLASSNVEICPKGITFVVYHRLPDGGEDTKHPFLVKHLKPARTGTLTRHVTEADNGDEVLSFKVRLIHPGR